MYSSRLWKGIPESHKSESPPRPRAARVRVGRGGCRRVDRHLFSNVPVLSSSSDTDDEEEREQRRRTDERWRFDRDDSPVVGVKGMDEQHRQLVDEFDTK